MADDKHTRSDSLPGARPNAVAIDEARRAITCLRDAARNAGLHNFQRDPCVLMLHRALDELEELRARFDVSLPTSNEPPVGWCNGSSTRPHYLNIEWMDCYTICTQCKRALRYNTAEEIERMHGRTPPDWWPTKRIRQPESCS